MLAFASLVPLPARADDALWRALGETDGIRALMTDVVHRLKADARIGHFFEDVDGKYLAGQLGDQVCELAGGPCKFDGSNMKDVHENLGIATADFDRLVELLQDAMDARGIPFRTQSRLLALLAPMHRDIVTR